MRHLQKRLVLYEPYESKYVTYSVLKDVSLLSVQHLYENYGICPSLLVAVLLTR
jgi:hypothetical protein